MTVSDPISDQILAERAAEVAARQDDHAARLALVELLGEAVRAGRDFAPPPLPARHGEKPVLSVVLCSIDDAKCAAATAMYGRLLKDWPHQIVIIRDARSLCEAYGRAVRHARGDILVFSHDDVTILAEDFAERLVGHLQAYDVVGFAGTTRLAGPAWIQGGWRFARGQLATRQGGRFRADIYGVGGAADGGVQAIDGLCLACRREVAERVGFDAVQFDGFHLYDVDFTWRACQAGYRLGVINDIPLIHYSTGRLTQTWMGFAERFVAKNPAAGFTYKLSENPLRATFFDEQRHIAPFFHGVLQLVAAHPGLFAPPVSVPAIPGPAIPSPEKVSTPMTDIRLGIPWNLTEAHGWGLVGTHTTLYLLDIDKAPVLLAPPVLSTMRPETRQRIEPLMSDYRQIADWLQRNKPPAVSLPTVDVLHPLGNLLNEEEAARRFVGRRNIGVIAFEDTRIDAAALARGKSYDFIITHSHYNARLLREAGLSDVRLAFQGIDDTEMVRLERRRVFGNRFVVFSGGKLEFRKGQDLVLEAFKRFHARHPEALLVTAWHSPWPQLSLDIAASPHTRVPPRIENNRLQISRWAIDNGLPPEAFFDLGFLGRGSIAAVLAECDAALFPNRCEGATNLVAMEAMACAVPCVISANTGHVDIIRDDLCYPLRDQAPVPDSTGARRDWGESSVDEMVAQLEAILATPDQARQRGERAAAFIRGERTWRKFAEAFVAEATR